MSHSQTLCIGKGEERSGQIGRLWEKAWGQLLQIPPTKGAGLTRHGQISFGTVGPDVLDLSPTPHSHLSHVQLRWLCRAVVRRQGTWLSIPSGLLWELWELMLVK